MVVFTCQHCGSSLKKKMVEKHSFQCRKEPHLTCVDCLKDFHGNEFVAHTSCVTEEERYSAKGFKSKPPSNKGAIKQESWMNSVHDSVNEPDINLKQRNIIEIILKLGGVPQKRAKFHNYVRNAFRKPCTAHEIDTLFDIISKVHDRKVKNRVNEKISENNVKNVMNVKEDKTDGEAQQYHTDKKRKSSENTGTNSSKNGSEEIKKKKRKKKKSGESNGNVSLTEENDTKGNENNEISSDASYQEKGVEDEEVRKDPNSLSEDGQSPTEKKLSKKERKKKRKQKKYESELNEIEHFTKENGVEEHKPDDNKDNIISKVHDRNRTESNLVNVMNGKEDKADGAQQNYTDKKRKSSENTGTNSSKNSSEEIKEKKKKRGEINGNVSLTEENDTKGSENNENSLDASYQEKGIVDDPTEKKLSKKERKEKRKREKYESELKEIENFTKENGIEEHNPDDNEDNTSEKKKKRKNKNRENSEQVEGNENACRSNGQNSMEEEPPSKRLKHSNAENPEDTSTENSQEKKPFNWIGTIIKVLQSRSDNELSVNRLSKKVIAEYQSMNSGHESYEKLICKFNKKVLKVPGVKVLKDKAKLVNCD